MNPLVSDSKERLNAVMQLVRDHLGENYTQTGGELDEAVANFINGGALNLILLPPNLMTRSEISVTNTRGGSNAPYQLPYLDINSSYLGVDVVDGELTIMYSPLVSDAHMLVGRASSTDIVMDALYMSASLNSLGDRTSIQVPANLTNDMRTVYLKAIGEVREPVLQFVGMNSEQADHSMLSGIQIAEQVDQSQEMTTSVETARSRFLQEDNQEFIRALDSVPTDPLTVRNGADGLQAVFEPLSEAKVLVKDGRLLIIEASTQQVVFEYTKFGWAQRQFSSEHVDVNLDLSAMSDAEGVRAKDYKIVGGMRLIAAIKPYQPGDADRFYPIDESLEKWASGGIAGGKVEKHPLVDDELSSPQILDALYFQIIAMITYDTENPTEAQLLAIKQKIENGEKVEIQTTQGKWDVTKGMEIHVGSYPEGDQKWFKETAASMTISTLATPSWYVKNGRLMLSLVNVKPGGILWLEKMIKNAINSFLTDQGVERNVSIVEEGVVNYIGTWKVLYGKINGLLRGVATSYTFPLEGGDLTKSP